MAVTGFDPTLVDTARSLSTVRRQFPDTISVLDTTELRWFAEGAVPADIGRWFGASAGTLEERCDTYLLGGHEDIGVKCRFRETLELKARQSLDGRVALGGGLAGSLEVWRRWSPAETLFDVGTAGQWVDVCKSIVKRRFTNDGSEIAFSPEAQAERVGCDIEIVEVSIGTFRAWSFAFAAFGPQPDRRAALLSSWKELLAGGGCPESFGRRVGRAMGYPQWLALVHEGRTLPMYQPPR